MREYTKQQVSDLKNIMSIEEEMIPLLHVFKPKNRILNPWQKQLPIIFKKMRLEKGMKIIDLPCGQGGVSVPLAKRYGAEVMGYDIVPAYVRYAQEYAKEKEVSDLCKFRVADIREAVKRRNICDVLLWIGPPHVWGRSHPTISRLRNVVKNRGRIVIADAYLYPKVKSTGMYKDYESFKNTTKGYTSLGDEIIEINDYGSSLWDFDYERTRKEVARGVKRARTEKERNIVKRCLESLDGFQSEEEHTLGLAIWVLRVNK
jgi:cyclopropane fatty-acyl-phospholipid synthase-like methyltransferase